MEELLEIQMFLYVQGMKEGDIPCGLSIIVTGIYLYVRYKYFCVYVNGRKAGDNPHGLANTDTDFCKYVRDTDFSA